MSEEPQGGDLYDKSMGDVRGGNVQFNYGGEQGRSHHSVYGEGVHFSWDNYPDSDLRNEDPGPDVHITGHRH